jgi:two-component sensor histidine kinase
MEADHAARVQWVMGRLIVELTRHSVRAGTVTSDRSPEEENHRIMIIVQETGKKMNDGFRTERQTRLGQGIVSQTLSQVRTAEHSRERVGLSF